MCNESVHAVFEVLLLIGDFSIIVMCSVVHFLRGQPDNYGSGVRDGILTLVVFYAGGVTASIFHFFRHELARQKHRSIWKQCAAILVIFVPSYYILKWNILRCKQPESLTVKSWTASLMLFYCSIGSLIQAILQAYVVFLLWWMVVERSTIYFLIFGALFFSLYALYGICNYIFTQYYDEIHEHLAIWDKVIVIIAFFLSIGGRVSAMAVVMVTLGWALIMGPIAAFTLNLIVYIAIWARNIRKKPVNQGRRDSHPNYISQFLFLTILAFLSAMTMSDKRSITLVTFLIWVTSYIVQLYYHHNEISFILVWIIPTIAQVVGVVFVMIRWKVFVTAFERFKRVVTN